MNYIIKIFQNHSRISEEARYTSLFRLTATSPFGMGGFLVLSFPMMVGAEMNTT